MQELEMDLSLKVIIVGNGMVGKTSMITRFARGIMTENYKKTIGTDFMEKEICVKATGDPIKLMLWDTAGQEMFSKLTRQYYRGSGAVVYVFSTIDRESFLEIERWKQKVDAECGEICSVLVQNKCDLIDQAAMTREEVEDLARRMGVKLYRTCVKDNILVDDVFDYLSEQFIRGGGAQSSSHEPVPEIGSLTVDANANNSVAATSAAEENNNANNSNNLDEPKSPLSNTQQSNGTSNSSGSGSGSNTSNSSGSGSAGSNRAAGTGQSETFKLQPLTLRTQGKKKSFCTIL